MLIMLFISQETPYYADISPFSEANSRSASQEYTPYSMEPEDS